MRVRSFLRGALPLGLAATVLGGASGALLPTAASAEDGASELQFIIVSDDIRKQTTEVARPSSNPNQEAAPAPAPAAPAPAGPAPADPTPAGPAPAGSGGSGSGGSGHQNNGHGNNADGVDSSNPGQGSGGPNGAVDPSGSVDDEAGGGGASPSKTNGNGGKKK